MYSEREASIVRFFAADNTVVGAGFLVAPDTVLTCAHVVIAALRIPRNQETPGAPMDPLCLDFPIVAPNHILSARVDAQYWQAPRPDGSGDIAILHLDGNAPDGVRAVRLVQTDEDLWEHDFRVFGYPDKHPDGVWASGELRGRRTAGWIQIEDVKVPGYRIQRGFSGGAIWDDQLGGVVGMAVAADTEAANKVAYMIPTSALVSAYPQLGQVAIPACPYRGLSAFREQDEPYFLGATPSHSNWSMPSLLNH